MIVTPRNQRETGRDYALRVIKDNIISMGLIPGSMMSENELAAAMGLSRTPVREALLELSKSKIVEIYPQRGSAVSLIDYSMVEEAGFMRNVLECAVARLACEIAGEEDLRELEDNVKLQRFYLENASTKELLELDNAFHRKLFDICDKMQSYELMNSFTVHLDRVRNLSLAVVDNSRNVVDHEEISGAICSRNPELTEQLLKKHLSRYKIDEADIRKNYPQYFKKNKS